MTRHVAALALPLALAAALCAAPDGPPARKVADLIAQLGDPDFARREAASKELEAIGAPARAALEKAARESEDMEVARRAAAVARKLARLAANDRTLAPTVVELSFDDTPVDDVLESLSNQTGYLVALGGTGADAAAARKVKVKTGRVPFWEAVGQVCEAADLQIASAGGFAAPGSTATTPAPRRPKPAPAGGPGAQAPAPADPVAAVKADLANLQKQQDELLAKMRAGGGADVVAELKKVLEARRAAEAEMIARLQKVVQDPPVAPQPVPAGRIAPAVAAARLQVAAPPGFPVPGANVADRQVAVLTAQLREAAARRQAAVDEEAKARQATLDALAASTKKGATEAEKAEAAKRLAEAQAQAAAAKAKLAAVRTEEQRLMLLLATAQAEARRPAAPFNAANAVILEPRTGKARPAAVNGAVRVESVPVPAAAAAADAVTAVLLVWPEPKLVWQQTTGVRVAKAADEHAQALAPDLVNAAAAAMLPQVINNGNVRLIRNPNGQVIFINNGNGQIEEVPGQFHPNARQALVRLKPGEKATGKLAELSGAVEGTVRSAAQPVAVVSDLTKAGAVNSPAGVSLTTTAMKKDASGWTVDITLKYDARAVTPSAPGEKAVAAGPNGNEEVVVMNGPGGVVRVNRVVGGRVVGSSSGGGHTYQGLRATDDKGRPFAPGVMTMQQMFNGGNATEMRFTLRLTRTAADQGDPKEITFWATRQVTVDVPFTLKDVPAVAAKK